MGKVFAYGWSSQVPVPALPMHLVEAGAWHITLNAPANPQAAQYLGVGFTLNGNPEGTHCVDASAYTGIRFTVSGTVTGCSFIYAVADSQHESESFDPRGTGDATVYAPQALVPGPTATPVTIAMPFSGTSAPAGGNPAVAIDKTKLTRVQWQFTVAPMTGTCAVDVRIDDVTFY